MTGETSERSLRQWTGVIASLGIVAVALAIGFIWARQERTALTFASAFTAWWGYLFAHYMETGEFVDGLEGTEHIRESAEWLVGAAVGVAVLVAGMVVGAVGIGAVAFTTTFAGAVLFLSGYVITHYAVTGHLL
jgi:hypothetical protein